MNSVMKLDNEILSDSELIIKSRFQDYMNEMQVKMMNLQGINNGNNNSNNKDNSESQDSYDKSHCESNESDNKSKRQRLFEKNVEEVRKELKYNSKENERLEFETGNKNRNLSLFVRLWCRLIGVKVNSVLMPKTNKEIKDMSFIEKLRYKTIIYIKQNKVK